ncbi:hypothetical protein D3C73_1077940 [compost metagenome]
MVWTILQSEGTDVLERSPLTFVSHGCSQAAVIHVVLVITHFTVLTVQWQPVISTFDAFHHGGQDDHFQVLDVHRELRADQPVEREQCFLGVRVGIRRLDARTFPTLFPFASRSCLNEPLDLTHVFHHVGVFHREFEQYISVVPAAQVNDVVTPCSQVPTSTLDVDQRFFSQVRQTRTHRDRQVNFVCCVFWPWNLQGDVDDLRQLLQRQCTNRTDPVKVRQAWRVIRRDDHLHRLTSQICIQLDLVTRSPQSQERCVVFVDFKIVNDRATVQVFRGQNVLGYQLT